ncbi:structural maintenance of chromosomes protein 6-like isoform X2 [Dysidea avara]|uniref:structural maintenance of chromosomes protein 6-like isoform X2 n=1 Tax=Dysidea avara TaxID=196820 RepID=UPI0033273484
MSEEPMSEDEFESSLSFSQLNTPMSQNPSKKPVTVYATAGKLVKILLTNFMCHRHLEVTFHDNVNVILGRNGSGKSAIMAAIIVGLGGKATTTSRNTSLQQFIRTGSNSAEIKLILSNAGQESYLADKYGRHIVILRRLQRDSSSYKIMSDKGELISNKKEELIKILDKFNIQVDNPVSLLNQETSRNFLHSTNPRTLYQLLMKATQLDCILRDYEHIDEQKAIMSDTIDRKKDNLKEMEVEVKRLEELYNGILGLQTLGEKMNDCNHELQWAYVNEIEKEAELHETKVMKERERIAKNEAKLKDFCDEARRVESREREIAQDLEQVNEEGKTIESRQEAARAEMRKLQKESQKIQSKINEIKREMKSKQNEKAALEKKIEETKQINFADNHAEHEQLQRNLEEAEQRHLGVRQEIEDCKRVITNHRESANEYSREQRQIADQMENLANSVRECHNSLAKLSSGSGHKLDIFGRWMITLVNRIQAESHHFRKLPMGPLGSMVTVKDPKWIIAIQKNIGTSNMYAFVVDNYEDSSALRQIMKDIFQREKVPFKFMPLIIQYHYTNRAYDCSTRAHVPSCPHPNVLSQLTISNATCTNVLIDHCRVESTILIEGNDEAEDFMVQAPPGVAGCYTLRGDQHLPAGRFYSNRDDPRRTKIYLTTSKEHHIRAQKGRLASLEQEQRQVGDKQEQVKTMVDRVKSEQRSVQGNLSKLQRNELSLKQRIEDLKTQCEDIQELTEEDVTTYEEEVRECDEVINDMKNQMQERQTTMVAMAQQVAEAKKEVEAASNDADTLAQRIESKQQLHAEAQRDTAKIHFNRNKCQQHIDKIRGTLNVMESTLQDINERLSDAISHAEGEHEERIETSRTTKEIIAEVKQIEKTLRDQEKEMGNADAIQRDLKSAIERFNTLQSQLNCSSELLTKLDVTMKMRVKQVKVWRESVSTRITGAFHTLMSQRGVKGSMKIDHKKGDLILMVKFHEEQSALATKNTKSLSGGERSFSTVAFIMSLWEVTDSPFRILDEFDVFMFAVIKKVTYM